MNWIKQNAKAISGLVLALVVAVALWWVASTVVGSIKSGEIIKQQHIENQRLQAANTKLQRLNDEARARERTFQAAYVAASTQYQKDLNHAQTGRNNALDGVRNGSLKLRVPVSTCTASAAGGTGQAPATPSRRDGATRAELSVPAAEFLVGLASEADQVVHQLTACQRLLQVDQPQ